MGGVGGREYSILVNILSWIRRVFSVSCLLTGIALCPRSGCKCMPYILEPTCAKVHPFDTIALLDR